MKCPVCSTEVNVNETICSSCGFDDIRYEFINDEELKMWQTYVVKPCKYAYRLNTTLKDEITVLRNELKKVCIGGSTEATRTTPPAKPQTVMLNGWNYDDPLSHPNSARCTHTVYHNVVELTDISARIDASRKGTIAFVAKRVEDTPEKQRYSIKEKTVGFCWRVKDEKGIIVLTGKWYNTNLLIGDAIADKIELKNVPNGYSIDFVDYT